MTELYDDEAECDLQPTDVNKEKYAEELYSWEPSLDRIKQLIENEKADINAKNRGHLNSLEGTPLFYAAKRGAADIVSYFIEKGGNLEATDKEGWTPLMAACFHGKKEVVNILLENGANVDAIDKDGNSPLILAAYFGNEDVVKMLMERNPKTLNHKENTGKNALQWALDEKHLKIADYLKGKGAIDN